MIEESVAPPSRPSWVSSGGLAAGVGGTGESPVKLPIAVAKGERKSR